MNKYIPYDIKEGCGYFKDIIECIQERVNIITEILYKEDPCKPVFTVSVMWKNENTQEIILNCTHSGRTFSRVLFPKEEHFFGYPELGDIIQSLYGQTI